MLIIRSFGNASGMLSPEAVWCEITRWVLALAATRQRLYSRGLIVPGLNPAVLLRAASGVAPSLGEHAVLYRESCYRQKLLGQSQPIRTQDAPSPG